MCCRIEYSRYSVARISRFPICMDEGGNMNIVKASMLAVIVTVLSAGPTHAQVTGAMDR